MVSIEVAAPAARVWRALSDPREVVEWESGVSEALETPPDYPRPGQHARWRTRSGVFQVLHDRPVEVEPERKLRSLLSLGPLRYDETYTIEPAPGGCRLTAALRVWTALPVVGHVIDRFYLGPKTRAEFEAALRSIKRRCES
ncbi:MAG TPA: SRPBCC family protein [Dehalococcoidia bacterium]|nr:SRPBCC family protein [Dehalococcoidia bacterium]